MPKRKRSEENVVNEPKPNEESLMSGVDSNDFEDICDSDESDYEPTAEEMAQIEEQLYNSDEGESVDDLDLEIRKRSVIDSEFLFKSKDEKVTYSLNPNSSARVFSMNTVPGFF